MEDRERQRTEKEIADDIAAEVDVSVRAGREFAMKFLRAVVDDLVTYGRVELRGLGTFAVSTRKARKGIHPGTGKPIKIKASKFVRFRSSLAVRRRLNPAAEKPPEVPKKKGRPKA